MNIHVNDESFATGLDVFEQSGGCDTALVIEKEFEFTAADASIEILFGFSCQKSRCSLPCRPIRSSLRGAIAGAFEVEEPERTCPSTAEELRADISAAGMIRPDTFRYVRICDGSTIDGPINIGPNLMSLVILRRHKLHR